MKMDYKPHSLEWWKELYEEKTKDKYDKLNNMFEVYNSSKGFAQYSSTVSKTLFVIYHVCGEADYWQALAKRLALASGKTHLCTLIKRNPIAYCRGRKWKIVYTKYHGDEKSLELKATNPDGYSVTITHRETTEDGRPIYYVVEQIKEVGLYCVSSKNKG